MQFALTDAPPRWGVARAVRALDGGVAVDAPIDVSLAATATVRRAMGIYTSRFGPPISPTPPPTPPPTPTSTISVLSMNFACRDVFPLYGCDNCQTRFARIAEAFSGSNPEGYLGIPVRQLRHRFGSFIAH